MVCLGLWFILALAPDMTIRLATIEEVTGIAAYLVLLGWTILGLWIAACTPSTVVRWAGAAIFAASAFAFTSFRQVTGQFLTYDAFINMLQSGGFVDDAVAQYGASLGWSLVLSLLLLLGIGLRPTVRITLPQILAPVPYVAIASVTALLFIRGGDGARGLPANYPTLAYAGLYGIESALTPEKAREKVGVPLSNEPVKHVVLVIDESVSGQYLDINSPSGVKTGLLQSRSDVEFSNFGIVPSITNCSVGSNLSLRFGGNRENYRDRLARGPSIWAYAKAASLRTVYIDAQRTGGALHNGMDDEETRLIDSFIQFDDSPVLTRDLRVADQIAREIARPEPSLIIANKIGAHFPVHDKFPDEYMVYRPALPRGRFADVTDTGSREGFDGSQRSWRLYRNSYRNALIWNVGVFFERLLSTADLSSSVVIYTSDHGQNLHEDGNPGLSTHCNSDPIGSEGAVPLVLISGVGLHNPSDVRPGQGSHYRIFPSLLHFMGYDRQGVQALYGPDLFNPSAEPDTFNARFNARLGQLPQWRSINAGALFNPVAQDAAMQDSTNSRAPKPGKSKATR